MDAAQRASFRENGYLVLRQAVDPAHIEALRALFDEHAIPEVREGPADVDPTPLSHNTRRAATLLPSQSCRWTVTSLIGATTS